MGKKDKEFSKIYDQCIDKIYRFIFLKVSSEEVAQDLCSETFLRGWEAYRDNPNIQNPSAFLYRVARNLVTDHYRQKGKAQFISPENVPIADPGPGIEEKLALDSDLEQVRVVLADLKEDYQNAIIWRYLDDLPMPEVAKLMDKTEETARVTLHRALKALRKEINNKREVREG